jgi:hypothetical protein
VSVSVVIPTRGDVPLGEILDWYPREWEKVVVNNALEVKRGNQDYKVCARFIGAMRAEHNIIITQDDDCVIENPEQLVEAWVSVRDARSEDDHVVCNMPANFRHSFYQEHALIGFGGVFAKSAPERVFKRLYGPQGYMTRLLNDEFLKCCDIAFTALSPRVLVDVPYRDLEWASAPNRMWVQPDHREGRAEYLRRVLEFRDKERA